MTIESVHLVIECSTMFSLRHMSFAGSPDDVVAREVALLSHERGMVQAVTEPTRLSVRPWSSITPA
jgi:hypothetical protein